MIPDLNHQVQSKQALQQLDHDKHTRLRHFSEGEKVFVKNQRPGGNPWLPGEIIEITGPVSYRVQLSDGTARQTHQDSLRKRSCEANPHEVSQDQCHPQRQWKLHPRLVYADILLLTFLLREEECSYVT